MSSTPASPLIARTVGVLAIAAGFLTGIYGLERPGSMWLPTALGLIVTGVVAQGYALYATLKRLRDPSGSKDRPRS